MNKQLVLSVKNLHKKIGHVHIIKGISFDVYAGEIFGFLGANGSGKTTTIRMLVNLIRPTSGNVTIDKFDVQQQHEAALARVGCIVETPELYHYLTGWENLQHFARMLPNITEKNIQKVVDLVGMDGRINDRVSTYSLGMRQRLGIAQALLNEPSLLILDEPTNGLDPQGIKELRLFIRKLADNGMAVFISSHMLSEVQLMCDRVAIISKGKVIAIDRVDNLLNAESDFMEWHVDDGESAIAIFRQFSNTAQLIEGNIIYLTATVNTVDVIKALIEVKISIKQIVLRSLTLEDLFLKLTTNDSAGAY